MCRQWASRLVILGLICSLVACGSPWLTFEDVPMTYTVQSGDTLHQVAFRYRLDPAALAQWNGIGRDARIIAGAPLRLRPPLPGQLHPVHGGAVVAGTRSSGATSAGTAAPSRVAQAPKPTPRPASGPVGIPQAPKDAASGSAVAAGVAKAPAVAQSAAPTAWQWPVDGKVIRRFGQGSDGIDISVPTTTAVRAVADGEVVYGGSALKGYGLLVILRHGESLMSAYAHTAELLVGEGQRVKAGQVIARSGRGPGQAELLHFEMRKNGQPADPMRWLPARD